jgi:DNA-directed RNA polymerase subunit RPC12/RpoP
MDVSVEIHCASCGSANYSLPDGEAESGAVACNDCGRRLGSVADLKAEMLEQALAHSAEALRRDLEWLQRDDGPGRAA